MRYSIARTWRHGIPLRYCIAALVVVTILVLTGLNLLNIRRTVGNTAYDLAKQQFALFMHDMRSGVQLHIEPVIQMVQNSSLFVRNTSLLSYGQARQSYRLSCIQALSSHRNILAINLGFHDGSFFSVSSLRDPQIRKRYQAPDNATFAIWAVAPNKRGEKVEWWEFLSADKGSLSLHTEPRDYDPRTRSWYSMAQQRGRLSLTNPYEFTTSRELGVTCTAPMGHGLGVVSVNITLRDFRNMLQSLQPSANSQIYLLDAQHRVIAGVSHQDNSIRLLDTSRLRPLEEHGIFAPETLSTLLYSTSETVRSIQLHDEGFFYLCDNIMIGDTVLTLLILAPVQDFTGFARDFLSSTLFFSLLSLLLAIPPVIFFSLRLSSSLQLLQERAIQIKKGMLEHGKPVISRIYEVQRLSRTLRSMRASIRHRTADLLHVQKELEQVVVERTKELTQARDQAEQATLAKSTFLSTVSHEMRTPLNAVIGFTHLFEQTGLCEKQKNSLEKIRHSSEQLLCVINDVLDFSKIEAGKLDIEIISFQPRALIDSVISVVSFSAQAKHLSLVAHVGDDVPETLKGDPNRLRQILLNLLNNAVKFTARGGITLELLRSPVPADPSEEVITLCFSVSDTGMGIEPQQLQAIFQPFVQADSSISRRHSGTGLGLAICRHLVELMGGRMQVTSEVGQGTCFSFTLPMTSTAEQGAASGTHETGLPALPPSRLSARVLVVDDNAINREIACALLESLGLENIDTAEDGDDAVQKVLEVPYELVFMDMQMPGKDGLEAARAIRATSREDRNTRPWLAGLPIVAMTGNTMAEDRKRCLDAGMDDHISKPLLPDVLHALLLRWLPDTQG